MAEAVSLAASIIAIVDLTTKIGNLCFKYANAVKDAKADITRLQIQLKNLEATAEGAQALVNGESGSKLVTSRRLLDSLNDCNALLVNLLARLDGGRSSKPMRRFGLRSLKWPFERQEMDTIITHLERNEKSIDLALQVDQTYVMVYRWKNPVHSYALYLEPFSLTSAKESTSSPLNKPRIQEVRRVS